MNIKPKVDLKMQEARDANIKVVKNMRDYSNDPTVKKSANDAIAFLKKHGLPPSFQRKQKLKK